jgi:hypothetical protein
MCDKDKRIPFLSPVVVCLRFVGKSCSLCSPGVSQRERRSFLLARCGFLIIAIVSWSQNVAEANNKVVRVTEQQEGTTNFPCAYFLSLSLLFFSFLHQLISFRVCSNGPRRPPPSPSHEQSFAFLQCHFCFQLSSLHHHHHLHPLLSLCPIFQRNSISVHMCTHTYIRLS